MFSKMRYDYKIIPDSTMLAVLNSLFSIKAELKNSKIINIQEFFGKETSKFILEEMIIAGFHPRDMLSILSACGFSVKLSDSYLNGKNLLNRLRTSPTSYRIFRKHGWNKVDSG
jgi:hypothetical protein